MTRTSTLVYGGNKPYLVKTIIENTGRKREKLDEIPNKSGRRMLKNTR
ncbi:hypothetical protein RV11_GL003497 [Enterococcus phoeniculicola]|nr:hypothetical protein RV11_GL003497 [Enterococcus phoeniculicola]